MVARNGKKLPFFEVTLRSLGRIPHRCCGQGADGWTLTNTSTVLVALPVRKCIRVSKKFVYFLAQAAVRQHRTNISVKKSVNKPVAMATADFHLTDDCQLCAGWHSPPIPRSNPLSLSRMRESAKVSYLWVYSDDGSGVERAEAS